MTIRLTDYQTNALLPRILLLTQVLPYPLDTGAKVRAYHMLRHLAAQHQVTLVSFVRPDDPASAVEHLRGLCHAVHTVPMRRSAARNVRAAVKGLLTGLPMVIARDEMAEMAALLRRLTQEQQFAVVHADQLAMAWWGTLAARSQAAHSQRGPATLLDEHNAIYLLARRMAQEEPHPLRRLLMRREARAFARYEAAMCRAYDAVLTVTEEDKAHLLALLNGAGQPAVPDTALAQKFRYVPICVDTEQTQPIPRTDQGPPCILHLGTMFWPPNVNGVLWFARQVLPLIHAHAPDARFIIAGKNPPDQVRELAADPRIEVTGYVPDAMPYVAAADAFVVPLHTGGGMRVKILDGWMWGLPVVSTPIGAEGIFIRDGENILIAGDAAAFASATLRLLTEPALNARLRAAGRAWVEQQYSWQAIYRKVDAVYAHLIDSR